MLYFAYGANLDIIDFRNRCPDATGVAKLIMPNFKLVFRGYANIEKAEGNSVEGAIYKISKEDEVNLDLFEGCNPADPRRSLYTKAYLKTQHGAVMYYAMNLSYCPNLELPKLHYFSTIWQGYKDWHLDTEKLKLAWDEALHDVHDNYHGFLALNDLPDPPPGTLN